MLAEANVHYEQDISPLYEPVEAISGNPTVQYAHKYLRNHSHCTLCTYNYCDMSFSVYISLYFIFALFYFIVFYLLLRF